MELFKNIYFIIGNSCLVLACISTLIIFLRTSSAQSLCHKQVMDQLRIIESKVSDLSVRVSIAEVRLEERKVPPLLLPKKEHVTRRGRKPQEKKPRE